MADIKSYTNLTIPTAGGTAVYPADEVSSEIFLTRESSSIVSNFAFAISGTPENGTKLTVYHPGNLTIGANIFSIMGYVFSEAEALGKCKIEAIYNDDWKFELIHGSNQFGNPVVDGKSIIDGTTDGDALIDGTAPLLKLETAGSRGKALRTGAAGVVEEFDAKTAGNLVYGDGTDVVSTPVGGDLDLDGSGNLTLKNLVVEKRHLKYLPAEYNIATATIEAAELLLLNSVPSGMIVSPTATEYIKIISASAYMTYNTNAYDTNVILQAITVGADIAQFENDQALPSTVSRGTDFFPVQTTTAAETQLVLGAGVELKVKTAEAASGSGTLSVTIIYAVVDTAAPTV